MKRTFRPLLLQCLGCARVQRFSIGYKRY